MTKYVDAGFEDPAPRGKNKKLKKGFKVDRRENFKRMMAYKATGKNASKGGAREARAARAKTVVFDAEDRKNYLLTLHKKKNERRVMAFVDSKRKQKKDNAKTRRDQREEARRAYNNYARIPILPNYTYQIPRYAEDEDEEEDEKEGAATHTLVTSSDTRHIATGAASGELSTAATQGGPAVSEESAHTTVPSARAVLRQRRAATLGSSTHVMTSIMTHGAQAKAKSDAAHDDDPAGGVGRQGASGRQTQAQHGLLHDEAKGKRCPPHAAPVRDAHAPVKARVDDDYVTVDVRPLFGNHSAAAPAAMADSNSDTDDEGDGSHRRAGGEDAAGLSRQPRALPSRDFSDLPAIVQAELRRLRQETKGPAQTKSRVRMMKEMEKIRKIKKHSRKGHNKRRSTGKRKNRKK